jgi:PmbA protein
VLTDRKRLLELADTILASAAPGEAVEVYVARSNTTTVRAYDGAVESLTSAEVSGVGVRLIDGGRMGFAHAGGLDPGIALECLDQARDNSRFAEPDEFVALVSGAEAVADDLADPPVRWSERLAQRPVEEKIDAALSLEASTRAADPRITGVRSSIYSDAGGESALVSSTGVRRWSRANRCSLSVVAMASDGQGDATVGWANDSSRDPDSFSESELAELAALRATGLLGATKPASARTAIVLEPRLAATLLGIVAGMLSGERLLKGRTPFADRVGSEIAAPALSFADDTTDAASLAASAFDGEGVASRRVNLVEDGVLQGFLHNTYTARRAGTSTTASAVRGYRSTPGVGCRALSVMGGSADVESLIDGLESGIIVQSMTGLHSGVNAVSGDFSVGIEGHAVRSGRVAEPIREATAASSVQRLLGGIVAIGDDLTYLPSGATAPTLIIEGVSLSGT